MVLSLEDKKEKRRAAQKRYRDAHKEELAAKRKAYKETHKEQRQAQRARARERKKEETLQEPTNGDWEPVFSGVDGESFVTGEKLPDGSEKQAYLYLYRHDLGKPLLPQFPDEWTGGLRTARCLHYLTSKPTGGRKGIALVGFYLNFDFEWILKDLPQEGYKRAQHGEEIDFMGGYYRLLWIPNKLLEIKKMFWRDWQALQEGETPDTEDGEPRYSSTRIMDVSGFFQSGFLASLKKWGLWDHPLRKLITSGKAARGGFNWKRDYKDVKRYNQAEQLLLEELMTRVYHAFKDAYAQTNLDFSRINAYSWSGPGVFSNDFLRQTLWNEQHPQVSKAVADEFWEHANLPSKNNKEHPFSMAYYGGRIELSTVGYIGRSYNNDVRSAYPYATSLLPKWDAADFRYVEDMRPYVTGKDSSGAPIRRAGMVHVVFNFPEGWDFYPFPVRVKKHGAPNVYYPKNGDTYIMSPEFFAFWDNASESEKRCVAILDGIVLDQDDFNGDGLHKAERLSTTARYVSNMAAVRLALKKAKASAEKALKLILNSIYGKTVQQVGKHQYFNDFASAWITSVCRSLLWRAIAEHKDDGNILMTMTDGLYSRVPLSFCRSRLSDQLGDFEEEVFDKLDLFKPGIYRHGELTYHAKRPPARRYEYTWTYRVRGFFAPSLAMKQKLFDEIKKALTIKDYIGLFPSRNFLTRNITLDGWKRQPYRYQFYDDEKEIKSELRAKRSIRNDWKLYAYTDSLLFPPKLGDGLNQTEGYELMFDAAPMEGPAASEPVADTDDAINDLLERMDAGADVADMFADFDEW